MESSFTNHHGKSKLVLFSESGVEISVFDWLREVWFDSNYPEFPKKIKV